jgi:hypothetical protein
MFATLLKHTKSKQYVCHLSQTYQIETVCLPLCSNIPNRNSMFATLLKHTKSKQYVCHLSQTYQIETVCLPSISNILNRNSMFALLHININHLILPTQGFWELPVSHVVNILLCCSQISIGLSKLCLTVSPNTTHYLF